jgi:hypothetical protein
MGKIEPPASHKCGALAPLEKPYEYRNIFKKSDFPSWK